MVSAGFGFDEAPSAGEPLMADVAAAREGRRERDGFVAPAQAMAFPKLARGRATVAAPRAAAARRAAGSPGVFARRAEELAYLDVLVAGCSFRSRRFRAAEATGAVLPDLLDECPVVPKGAPQASGRPLLRVSPEFEFVSEMRQITWARRFLESLPERLLASLVTARPHQLEGVLDAAGCRTVIVSCPHT